MASQALIQILARLEQDKESLIPAGEELDRLYLKRIDEFEDAVKLWSVGDMSEEEFRPIRLSMGIYKQLPEVSHLYRIKIPAGFIPCDQAVALADLGDQYARGLPHISTRQNVQYHWVSVEDGPELFRKLWKVGIETIGASADGARNVTADPLGGVDPDEMLDSTPYALLLNAYTRFHECNLKMPKKFKLAVSGSRADNQRVAMHDAAFLAEEKDGHKGFSVWVGGGLGSHPFLAACVQDFVAADDLLVACDALMNIYHDHGIRTPRSKARIKFTVQSLGREKFTALYDEYYKRSEANRGDDLRSAAQAWLDDWQAPEPRLAADAVAGEPLSGAQWDAWLEHNTTVQKQAGYRAVWVKLPLGDLTSDQLRGLASLAREYGADYLRATILQKLVIPWIPQGCLPAVYQQLTELELAESGVGLISDVVCCPGLDYCSLAVAKSKSLGERVRSYLAEGHVDEGRLGRFDLQMSGCPNACGQHSMADIGATGMMIKDATGRSVPHYALFVGGRSAGADSRIGTRLRGRYPEEQAPEVIGALASDYSQNRQRDEDYPDYVERKGMDHINGIALQFEHR